MSGPADTSTPSKVELSRSHLETMFSDSRHSFTASELGASNTFACPSGSTFHHATYIPGPSLSGSQHVTSSRWYMQAPLSPLHLQVLDPVTLDQAAKLYKLVAKCQVLGSDLVKKFHNLCGLEGGHWTAVQSTVHEMVLSGCQAHSATYGLATTMQTGPERELTLCRLRKAANKVWKDANNVMFMYLLQYNMELASFISSAEDALQDKQERVWQCIHGILGTTSWGHAS